MKRVETSCATALRLAMWEHHAVQPAAREVLGRQAAIFRQIGSYNCRPIAQHVAPAIVGAPIPRLTRLT